MFFILFWFLGLVSEGEKESERVRERGREGERGVRGKKGKKEREKKLQ